MKVLIVTGMRNEGPFILEWIAHHRAIGVTDFIVHSNDCEDGTDQLLDRLQGGGVISHVPLGEIGEKGPQWTYLNAVSSSIASTGCDWAICLDCDEFLNPLAPAENLNAVLAAAGEAGAQAIAVPWRLFGHAGHLRFADLPVTQQFTRAAPQPCHYPVAASFFKTLYRPDGPFRAPGVHRPRQTATPMMLGPDLAPVPDEISARQNRILLYGFDGTGAVLQLNHYSVRSAESFLVKRDRGLANRKNRRIDLAYWVERNFNTVEDRSILRHAPAMARELKALRDIPGVSAAHEAACAWHRARIAALLKKEPVVKFLGRLVLAGDSRDPGPEIARALTALYAEAARGV